MKNQNTTLSEQSWSSVEYRWNRGILYMSHERSLFFVQALQ